MRLCPQDSPRHEARDLVSSSMQHDKPKNVTLYRGISTGHRRFFHDVAEGLCSIRHSGGF